jgi:hypothetical protein
LNSRNLNGDLDAKLASCIPGLKFVFSEKKLFFTIRKQNPYQHQFVNVNNNNYTCCAKMARKEETPKCRKKTVTWTNEMIEDLIDFIEIHPIAYVKPGIHDTSFASKKT